MTHGGPVLGAAFDKDERRILSWSRDKTLRLITMRAIRFRFTEWLKQRNLK